jgi:hypothetical protein
MTPQVAKCLEPLFVLRVSHNAAHIFEPGVANVLFPIPGNEVRRAYAPSGDGRRFLITRPVDDTAAEPITVVLNWEAGLKK